MKRRDFLQLLAATGMTASLPFSIRQAHAAAPDHFFICVGANGGWDPTSMMDPKGLNQAYADRASGNYDGSVNKVDLDPTKITGQIRWSAIPRINGSDEQTARVEGQYDNFFTSYGSRMTVINGIDTGTNNHDTGQRHVFSGYMEMGYPNFAALYAGTVAPSLPMAFISNGGYDETAGLVARARANNADYLAGLADPNRRDNTNGYHYRAAAAEGAEKDVDHYELIKQAQEARIARQQSKEELPLRARQLRDLALVRNEESNLGAMEEFVDQLNTNLSRDTHMNNRNRGFKSQVQVAVASMKAGLTAGAMLTHGGYDTHGNHDNTHYPNMGDLLEGLDYLMLALNELGIANKTTVVVGSDFGRTPFYNSGNGKDHWNVTSMMVVRPTGNGGKVFGATNDEFNALAVNAQTGLADSSGIVITPAHVQKQLRKLAGIDETLTVAGFPLGVEDINLFD